MINEKQLAEHERHYPLFWRFGGSVPRDSLGGSRAAYVADPLRGHDGIARLPTHGREEGSGQGRQRVSGSWESMKYKVTLVYLALVTLFVIVFTML